MTRSPHRTRCWRAWGTLAAFTASCVAGAASPTPAELVKLCAGAEDQAHCGRIVEARQLARLKRFVARNGDELRIDLLPDGSTVFRDAVNIVGARTYAVWDYLDDLETLVLFATNGDRTEFWMVQRRGGGEFRIPSDPVVAPDRRRFATADFCTEECENEVAVWRIDAGNVRKELAWTPREQWADASVGWKSPGVIVIDYARADDSARHTLERRLDDPAWNRVR